MVADERKQERQNEGELPDGTQGYAHAASPRLTDFFWTRFVAQGICRLDARSAIPIGTEWTSRDDWTQELVLRNAFNSSPPDEKMPAAFALVRRTDEAIESYDLGCELLQAFAHGPRTMRSYFRALNAFERAVACARELHDIVYKLTNQKTFVRDDGSPADRIRELSNIRKHTSPSALPAGHLHALWLEGDGVHGAELKESRENRVVVTFQELRAMLLEFGGAVDRVVSGGTRG